MSLDVKGKIINYEDVNALFATIPVKECRETELFVKGDHWQDGAGWTGWQPESDNPDALKQMFLVERLFNAKNVCGGMVSRIRGASLGKEPDWEIVPRNRPDADATLPAENAGLASDPQTEPKLTAEEEYFREVDKTLTRWWTDKGVHGKLKEFVGNKAAYGKSAIRIHVPPGYVRDGSNGASYVEVKDLDDALDKIFIEVPHYSNIIDVTDRNYGRRFTALKVEKVEETDQDRFEICYVDQDKQTVLRQMDATGTMQGGVNNIQPRGVPPQPPAQKQVMVDLGGNLLTHVTGEYREAIISPTVKYQQKAVNHAKTGENFALANINFPETTFINVDLETESKTVSGKKTDVPKPMAQGAGRFRNLMGFFTSDVQGGERLNTPDVKWRDGADPEKFARVAANNTRDMHQEAGMLYIYLADSEYASGESKIESMTDYLILLVDSKTLLDTTGSWLLTTVLRLAFNLMRKMDQLDEFDVIFSSNLTIGKISNEDKQIMLDEVAKGLRSQRNYMIKAEVTDDPASELKVIRIDGPLKDAQPDPVTLMQKQAEINQKFPPKPVATGAGAGSK